MKKNYIGIDNGTTGTVSIVDLRGRVFHFPVPTKRELSYTKTKQTITRVDTVSLEKKITQLTSRKSQTFCLVENPMINPTRFKQSISAARALEAVLIVLEKLKIPYQYIPAKEWQKIFIPKNILTLKTKDKSAVLKRAVIDIARRLFPAITTKDADSLLIVEYAKRNNL